METRASVGQHVEVVFWATPALPASRARDLAVWAARVKRPVLGAADLAVPAGILAEVTLLVVLIRLGRAAFRASQQPPDEADAADDERTHSPLPPFREIHLEVAFGIAAAVALSWCFVIGLESPSFRIAVIVIEGFALLFLLIFMPSALLQPAKFARSPWLA